MHVTTHRKRSWFIRPLTLLAVISLIAFHYGSPAQAANGSNLRTVIADESGTACVAYNAAGDHFSVGIGIAFNGANLLISCEGDSTVTVISPSDGSQVPPPSMSLHPAVHFISGANPLSALAFQGPAGPLWGCGGYNTVGLVDLVANTFTPVFNTALAVFPDMQVGGSGCRDGLAYDGQDNTIWASGDASTETDHYTVTGVGLAHYSNSGLIGGCGNSGIAVGGQLLYLANDGCSQIYEVQKNFSSSNLFASFARRLEDLECDDLTFAATVMKGAIWSKDAYDNVLNAWEIPLGQCAFGGGGGPGPGLMGRMTGGGSIQDPVYGRVTHGFQLKCTSMSNPNSLEVNWGNGNNFHLTALGTALCTDDPTIDEGKPVAGFDTYDGTGTGTYNGTPGATASWKFTDAGEPGTNDFAHITITVGMTVVLDAQGKLQNGNHQAHQCAACP
jgi:hypothetical protein